MLDLFICLPNHQSFTFFGFMVAGEEIESEQRASVVSFASLNISQFKDPFGYDKNDLNLDHFTHNIISKCLCPLSFYLLMIMPILRYLISRKRITGSDIFSPSRSCNVGICSREQPLIFEWAR